MFKVKGSYGLAFTLSLLTLLILAQVTAQGQLQQDVAQISAPEQVLSAQKIFVANASGDISTTDLTKLYGTPICHTASSTRACGTGENLRFITNWTDCCSIDNTAQCISQRGIPKIGRLPALYMSIRTAMLAKERNVPNPKSPRTIPCLPARASNNAAGKIVKTCAIPKYVKYRRTAPI